MSTMTGVIPHDNDVLFGRGFTIFSHPGNVRLRSLVRDEKGRFQSARKNEKRNIARRIVDEIRNSDPPGRFLMEDPRTTPSGSGSGAGKNKDPVRERSWVHVEETERAVDKVMHRLREKDRTTAGAAATGDAAVSKKQRQKQQQQKQQQQKQQQQKQQQQQRRPAAGGPPPQAAPLLSRSYADVDDEDDDDDDDDDVARLLKSMQESTILSLPVGQEQQGSSSQQQESRDVETNDDADMLPIQQAKDHWPTSQMVSRPIGQTDEKKQSFQQSNAGEKRPIPKVGAQSNVGDEWFDSPSDGLSDVGSALLDSLADERIQNMSHVGEESSGSQSVESPVSLEASVAANELAGSALANVESVESPVSLETSEAANELAGSALANARVTSGIPSLENEDSDDSLDHLLNNNSRSHRNRHRSSSPESKDSCDSLDHLLNDDPTPDQISRHQKNPPRQFPTVTLREWIDKTMPGPAERTTTPGRPTAETRSYVRSAIPLALELTECLIKMDENGKGDSFAARLTCENVLIGAGESFGDFKSVEIEDNPDPDEVKAPLLFSLGAILYELFSSKSGQDVANVMVKDLSLEEDEATECDHRPSKRSQPNSSQPGSNITGEFVAELEVLGIPHSLCALVENLLDCIHGDVRGEDAYRSLADVRTDLLLMRDDPARFLDDLQVDGRAPSFEVGSKFYGREGDVSSIEECYRQHAHGEGRGGVIVSGGAGVGKSSLVMGTTRRLAEEAGAYFLEAKFDQGRGASPLSTIGTAFNSLCDMFVRDATPSQSEAVAEALTGALGNQAGLLAGVIPSLSKLIAFSADGASKECIDKAASMRFLFMKLLEALSEHRRVSFFLDDLQFADPSSLLLISSMLSNAGEGGGGRVFFACCYRDDDVREDGPFVLWLSSVDSFPLERMELKNIGVKGVNELVSEALRLFPRITRPLASILHHKTRGNPLFLRQLLDLLKDQGYIYLGLSPLRWTWNIAKIINLEISDDVVALLIKEMQRLSTELQLGLKVASCMGYCVKYSTFDILSQALGVNMRDLLDQAAHKGYMVHVDQTKIRFVHDKIQQAAYEMMPARERLENHMRYGLVLSSHASNDDDENGEIFFVAVHQINRGGPGVLADPKQKEMAAALNLKAGKRSMELSDFSTALSLFEHGITFLESGRCWTTQYALTLELFDAAVEMACALSNMATITRLSEEVFTEAKCNDDKLICLYAVVKSLRLTYKFHDAKNVAFTMIKQLGERFPRPRDDVGVDADIQKMQLALRSMSNELILNMKETDQKKRDILMLNLYHDLSFVFQFIDATRMTDAGLRMAQITLSNGLCCMSPLAFAVFAIQLVSLGDAGLGYRVGTLALKLLDKINAQRYTSAVIALVGTLVSWVAEPLQSTAESHLLGYECGQRSGDAASTILNYQFYLMANYLSGQSLSITRVKSREFAHKLLQRKQIYMFNIVCTVHLQTVALIEGLEFGDAENRRHKFPNWADMLSQARLSSNKEHPRIFLSHLYMRSFLFKEYNQIPVDGLLDAMLQQSVSIRPIFCCGIFFEGLVSLQLARQTNDKEHHRRGEAALIFIRNLSKQSPWNFSNKHLLLEAEMINFSGYYDHASLLYEDAIRSSNKHKFIQEEAIASELAATFFYERGLHEKSQSLFLHSVNCYKKWGASAIATRVENDILVKFGSGLVQLEPIDDFLASFLGANCFSEETP